MDLSEKVESIGGGGGAAYAAGGWGIGLFLMAIFLVVLFSLFCRGGWGGHEGHAEAREGCADKLTWARYANYVDPEMAHAAVQECRDSGEIRKDLAEDNGQILASLDRQTRDIQLNQERTTNTITLGQAAIAREQERMFFQGEINRKDERLADQRERATMLESRLMQAESAREADRRQMETMGAMNAQFYSLTNRIAGIECNMVKAPQFYPYGGIASVNLCGYQPCHTNGGCGQYG